MAAILETSHHGWHRYNFTCLNIWICSQCINLYVYQFWCFYHKVNGWFSMPDYAAALLWGIRPWHMIKHVPPVDYQTLAHLSCSSCVYWISARATRAQRFVSENASKCRFFRKACQLKSASIQTPSPTLWNNVISQVDPEDHRRHRCEREEIDPVLSLNSSDSAYEFSCSPMRCIIFVH